MNEQFGLGHAIRVAIVQNEVRKVDDGMVICDLDGGLLKHATGREWIAARRPELDKVLTILTGVERNTHELEFEE